MYFENVNVTNSHTRLAERMKTAEGRPVAILVDSSLSSLVQTESPGRSPVPQRFAGM